MNTEPAKSLADQLKKFKELPGEIESLKNRLLESQQQLEELSAKADLDDESALNSISRLKDLVGVLPDRIEKLEVSAVLARRQLYLESNRFLRNEMVDYLDELIELVRNKVGKHFQLYVQEDRMNSSIENSEPMLKLRHHQKEINHGIRTSAIISEFNVSDESAISRAENFLALWDKLKELGSALS